MNLFFVALWASVGGVAAWRFHVPGGAFIGALLACVLYRTFAAQLPNLPGPVSFLIQILAGILVASSFDPHLVKTFRHLLPWALAGAVFYIIVGFLLAHLFTALGILEPRTALYSLTPGGLMGMSVISSAENSQAGVVVMFHFIRVIFVLLVTPFIGYFIHR
jgi:membrane AbrB-like protein